MRHAWDTPASRLLLTLGVTASLFLTATVQARHVSHGPAPRDIAEVVTGFRFRDTTLTVDDGLPTGTVIAVVPLAARTLPVAVTGRSISVLTYPRGAEDTWRAVPTSLPGVGVRLVPSRGESVTPPDTGTLWYREAQRLELVKTGHVSSGLISDLTGLPAWELAQMHNGRQVVRARETLRLLRPLRIRSQARATAARAWVASPPS